MINSKLSAFLDKLFRKSSILYSRRVDACRRLMNKNIITVSLNCNATRQDGIFYNFFQQDQHLKIYLKLFSVISWPPLNHDTFNKCI
ncbi:hypothetical protein T10_9043 [Trichinella papuae]|uniref:Uncharacterized protein n=1 Tax=Trichinella papuae TaxID=268474 RepID=A0A0V1N585_9BILA|nr:hypothetical protein T10_9043 [Trichinella papuae]